MHVTVVFKQIFADGSIGMAFFFYQGAQLGFRLVSKMWGRGWGLSFCLKECCFRVRVRVRLGLGLGLVSTLTLTIILTLKQHSLNIRQTPTSAPAPNPTPTASPRFTDTRLLPHKLCKNLHSSGVYTSPCNSGTVLSGQAAHLAAGPM